MATAVAAPPPDVAAVPPEAGVAAAAIAGVASADRFAAPDSPGMLIFDPQWGQMPRLPAKKAFTFSFLPQV
jgi:hypothetical protein